MTKRRKLVLICCFGLAAALALAFCLLGVCGAFAEGADTGAENGVPQTAYIGDEIDIPAYEHETGSGPVTAQVRIIAPDGSVYGGNTLRITAVGKYTVEYVVDGVVVKELSCVAVYRPTDLFSVNKYAQVLGIDRYSYTESPVFTGVKVGIRAGAEIVFTREIDMTSGKKSDVFLSMLIEPNQARVRDFGQMILTLTDAEDEETYMTIIASDGNLDSLTPGNLSYVRAGGNGQTAGGFEFKNNSWVYNTTSIYGSPAPFSFEANNMAGAYDYALNLCYDAAENALYLKNGLSSFYGEPYKIVDFDDPSVFGTNLWHGFPSGKAKLSVTFDQFVSNSSTVIFAEVGGIDLSAGQILDQTPPSVTIDLGGEEKAPDSYLGAEYRIFPVDVYDFFDSDCRVRTEVKYDGMLGGGILDVSVEDGVFVTDKVGKYTIYYYVADLFGNESTAFVSFYCLGRTAAITLTGVPEDGAADVFDRIALVSADVVRAFGGSGKLGVTRTVTAPNGEVLAVEEDFFIPEQVGDYIIRYTATDYFGRTGSAEQIIHVQPVVGPVFVKEAALPEVVLAGFTYGLPEAGAKICSGTQVTDAQIKVFVGGKEVPGSAFIVPENVTELEVEYRAYDPSGAYVPLKKVIPVIDGEGGREQAVYFYSADGNIVPQEERDAVRLDVSADGRVAYANTLNGHAFSADLIYTDAKANFSTLRVRLIDSTDASCSITFGIAFTPFGLNISAPGVSAVPFSVRSDGVSKYLSLSYDNAARTVRDIDGNTLFILERNDEGGVFGGFEGGVYLELFFEGVKAQSVVSVTSINNQGFGYKESEEDPAGDTVAPEIIINGTYERRLSIGSSVTIFTAEAFDVLSQVASLTVSVYAPDNTCLLNAASADTEHSVTFEQAGRYRVIYSAVDSLGNAQGGTAGTNILVLDSVAPSLTVDGTLKETYKVGDEITLPSFRVSDDLGSVSCDIFLELPDNGMYLLIHSENGEQKSYLSPSDATYRVTFKVDEDTFKAEQTGRYTVTYLAYDANYNYVVQRFEFMVTE